MKSNMLALALFLGTAATVASFPFLNNVGASPVARPIDPIDPAHNISNEHPRVEVVFVLDTTGSMGGLIQTAKDKIWSIASTIASAQPAPEIRVGLIAYRDRGDDYITRVTDLSPDLDTLYATLMDYQAAGGGDGPESVNQALYDAVHKISWSQDQDTYRVVFLVGDAPPHMDYQDDVKYPVTLATAKQKGIVVNAIQCGKSPDTTNQWRHIAQLGTGEYLQVDQAGGAVAIATPYDKELAELAKKLDETRLYYGSHEDKARAERKLKATERLNAESSISSRARRAEFNAKAGRDSSFLGENELVDDVASGRVDLSKIEQDALPAPIQALPLAEQQRVIEEKAQARQTLQQKIEKLAEQRNDFLKEELEARGGAKDSLDEQVFSVVREQAGEKGLRYEEGAVVY